MQLDLEELILLHEDSPVKQYHKQDFKRQQKMIVGSGMKCLELYKIANRGGSLEKMLSVLLTSTKGFYSSKCKLIWKKKVTPYNRLLFQLVPKTHHTDEIGFGLLATPTTQEIEHPEATLTKNNIRLSKDGKSSHSLNLADTMKLWPTPVARDAGSHTITPNFPRGFNSNLVTEVELWKRSQEKMWPTPRASIGMTMGLSENMAKLRHKRYLETEMAYLIHKDNNLKDQAVGQLNSEWVTWLMGYPQGYLDISTENQNTSQELQQEKKTEPKS